MPGRKRVPLIPPTLLVELAAHAAMGVAIGLAFALTLIFFDAFGLKVLIAHSIDPQWTRETFAGAITLIFAIGATLTGLVLTMMERSERDQ
jgi:uncharacterized membrane protein YqjE